ncbi:hypothetical protein DFH07DRAFT_259133 [Mycena maculata]|uniref:Uncharacterized protein n=1 Tax=Mycena maculata TaxID=230809 RepID=A0AAD7NQY9_9AGAR|nr:hypothetical protein DFH07DRAFT_259133 [Mycena maculata]
MKLSQTILAALVLTLTPYTAAQSTSLSIPTLGPPTPSHVVSISDPLSILSTISSVASSPSSAASGSTVVPPPISPSLSGSAVSSPSATAPGSSGSGSTPTTASSPGTASSPSTTFNGNGAAGVAAKGFVVTLGAGIVAAALI